jgi:SAM-dependent methyltransferase
VKQSVWPKQRPVLTAVQQATLEDWYAYWLGLMPQQFKPIMRFNHAYPLRTYFSDAKTLEIGAGTGEHLHYEDWKGQDYKALEMRSNLAQEISNSFPGVQVLVGDCEKQIDIADRSVDRVIAIHVLEHLADLPSALDQIQRILKPGAKFSIVIPCEGGFGYALGRRVTSQRVFERRYKQDYTWLISHDHVNTAEEIIEEVKKRFRIVHSQFWPLRVPIINANLLIGLTAEPRH